jgi:aspartate kinase
MIVMKFGGSSVADAACMREAAALVRGALPCSPLVVLSATAGSTDALFEAARRAERGDLAGALALHRDLEQRHRDIARDLFPSGIPQPLVQALTELEAELEQLLGGVAALRELSPRSMDAVASIGERLSSRLLAAHLEAAWVDARTVVRTDDGFGFAAPSFPDLQALARERIAPLLGPGRAVVTQGCIGATAQGATTTLGRGGSDFSAALLGAALGAADIQIWTDVEGVLTCDPRLVPEAWPIAELSFAEAAELAAFGAKVLHPATIQPAMAAGIPVTVRHTFHPRGRFTTITAAAHAGRPITALAQRGPVTVITVAASGQADRGCFAAMAGAIRAFARHGIAVDLIATAKGSVCLAVDGAVPLEPLLVELGSLGTVAVARNRAIVAVVGERLKLTPGVSGRCFSALGGINIEMISMGANEMTLSLVVRREDSAAALRSLHAAFLQRPAGEDGQPAELARPWPEPEANVLHFV